MIDEARIKAIEERLDSLQASFLQAQKNQIPITVKTDENSSKVVELDAKVDEAISEMFPDWNPDGYDYFAGERVKYNDLLYRCIQSHKSQSDWTPDTAVSLWVAIDDPAIEWPEWHQPVGAHDAYMKGDKVSHNKKHWISDIDNNVYEPSVYGWSEAE